DAHLVGGGHHDHPVESPGDFGFEKQRALFDDHPARVAGDKFFEKPAHRRMDDPVKVLQLGRIAEYAFADVRPVNFTFAAIGTRAEQVCHGPPHLRQKISLFSGLVAFKYGATHQCEQFRHRALAASYAAGQSSNHNFLKITISTSRGSPTISATLVGISMK